VGVVPPLVGAAANITLVPDFMDPEGLAVIFTLAVTLLLTSIVIELDVAGDPVTPLKFDVIIQVMMFPFASEVEVYDELVAPDIAVPFFFH